MYRGNFTRFKFIQQSAQKKKAEQEKKKEEKIVEKEKKKAENDKMKAEKKQQNGRLPKDGTRWTDDDLGTLIKMLREKKSYEDISQVLERGENGLKFKRYQTETNMLKKDNNTKKDVADYFNITEEELEIDLQEYDKWNKTLNEVKEKKTEEIQKYTRKTLINHV